jgi:hypothetical protein
VGEGVGRGGRGGGLAQTVAPVGSRRRDDGTDDPDGGQPDIHRVGELVIRPDDTNGKVREDEWEIVALAVSRLPTGVKEDVSHNPVKDRSGRGPRCQRM